MVMRDTIRTEVSTFQGHAFWFKVRKDFFQSTKGMESAPGAWVPHYLLDCMLSLWGVFTHLLPFSSPTSLSSTSTSTIPNVCQAV